MLLLAVQLCQLGIKLLFTSHSEVAASRAQGITSLILVVTSLPEGAQLLLFLLQILLADDQLLARLLLQLLYMILLGLHPPFGELLLCRICCEPISDDEYGLKA